jgi:uncharacterized protein YbjT (DUF2867 family)
MGQKLITRLMVRGHEVRALVRPGSEKRLPPGCRAVVADALDGDSYVHQIAPADTFVQLVGVAHPSPAKAAEFRSVDLPSGLGAIEAARSAGIRHFVYLSVAHPAPMMRAYIAVRSECEAAIKTAGLNATILRPWYVLGPGHRWPYFLLPIYKIAELLPSTRDGAQRLGLVTLEQMTCALTVAVENPVQGIRVMTVPEIRTPCAWKAAPIVAFSLGDLFSLQSNARITKGACPWDIYSLSVADEMLGRQTEWPSKT